MVSLSDVSFCKQVGPILNPSGFIWNNKPFGIFRDKGGRVRTNFNPKDYDIKRSTTRYISYENGSDTHDGLTEDTAYKSLNYCLAQLVALNPASAEVVILSKNIGIGTTGWGNNIISFPLTLRSKVGLSYIAFNDGTGFASFSGVYRLNSSGASMVFDAKYKDNDGAPFRLVDVLSLAECQSTAGTRYFDSANTYCYIHLLDGRAPDVYVKCAAHGGFTPKINGNLYAENIAFVGGLNCVASKGTSDVIQIFNSCSFIGSYEDGLNIETTAGGFIAAYNCEAYHCGSDSLSYHHNGTLSVLEQNCLVIGYGGLNTSDNCSSMHDNGRIVRVGGTYVSTHEIARTIHDIGGSLSWNIECFATTGSRAGDALGNPAFAIGATSDTSESKMWIDDCIASGSGFYFGCFDNEALMYFKSFIPSVGAKNQLESMSVY